MDRAIVKLLGLCLIACLAGCSFFAPKPKFSQVVYDYQVPAPYALTDKHKKISVKINEGQSFPEEALSFEKLKLAWTPNIKNAQIRVYVNYSQPFLIERPDGVRKDVVYDKKGKGEIKYMAIQRAFIRTRYNIEIIDGVNDSLIRDYQFSHHYPIEAPQFRNTDQAASALKNVFFGSKSQAEKALIADVWEKLKVAYLKDVVVSFAQQEFNVVSEYEPEPKFTKAYDLLKLNNKLGAQKSLNIYNQLNKHYSKRLKEDDSKFNQNMLVYISQGISASAAILNHDYAPRY